MLGRTIAVALLLAPLVAAPTVAQTGKPAGARPDAANPIVVYTRDAARAAPAAALIARAREKGTIRVIVGLDLTMRDERLLSTVQETTQARALHDMQTAVLRRAVLGIAAERITRFDIIPFMSARVDAGQLARLIADPQVVFVKESLPLRPTLSESAPLIQADRLWTKNITGEGHAVVIVDSGWAGRHDMIKSEVIVQYEACFSMHDLESFYESLCPNGRPQQIGPGAARKCPNELEGCTHGTFVASIAAGSRYKKGQFIYRGIASGAKLIMVQAASRDTSLLRCDTAPCANFPRENVVNSLIYVLRLAKQQPSLKIAAVNLSLKAEDFADVCDAENPEYASIIGKLYRAGIAVVAGTGNDGLDGKIGAPACVSTAIAVGASTKDDKVWSDSNHSPLVKLMAPGKRIRAAAIEFGPDQFATVSGTSFATPHVAGAFALLRDAKPKATVDEMLTALECTGTRVKRPSGYELKKPRINLLFAMRHLQNPPDRPKRWDFDRASDAEDWEELSGVWGISQASNQWVLRRRNDKAVPNVSWHPSCYEDAEVEAHMQRSDRPIPCCWSTGGGLIVRGEFDKQSRTLSGYLVGYSAFRSDPRDHAVTILRRDHVSVIGEATGGNAVILCHTRLSDVGAAVNYNGYNRLKVIARGPNLRVFLNGDLVCGAVDSTYSTGAVGLFTDISPDDERNTNFRVKWTKITPLSSKSRGDVAAAWMNDAVHPEIYRRPSTSPAAALPR